MKLARTHPGEQLTSVELQQLKWILGGGVTLVSVATVFYLDIAAWTLLVLTTAAVLAVTVWPTLPGRIPRWVHWLSFPVIVALFTADLWTTGELLPAMVRLDMLLLLYRSVTYRQKRDDLQVIVLGLFLIVVAGVLTVSLTFAVHILAFTGCALAMLLVVTLAEAANAFRSTPQPPETTPDWAQTVDWGHLLARVRQVTDWRVVTLGVALFLGLVMLSALLFIAIPRFQLENGLFLERFISKKTRSGFSESIRFGDVTDIQQDNSVALSVDVSDRTQIPGAPYWRMLVLDEYKDGVFRFSAGMRRGYYGGELHRSFVRGTQPRQPGEPTIWTFYLESGVSRYLPTLGAFEELRFREPHNFQFLRRPELVVLRDEPATMIAYRVEGMRTDAVMRDLDFGRELGAQRERPSASASVMLNLPLEEFDRVALARIREEISGGVKLPAEEFGIRAAAWLARNHAYTLRPATPPGSGDPLIRWLNSTEAGHCELFAGSFAMLARSAGIPSRVVAGFRGGSWNSYSNNFTLRNSDAHAWCEIYDVKQQSWIRADPTPGFGNAGEANSVKGEAALARRNDRSWKARLESLRVFWYRRIVSFDQLSQLDTINSVKQAGEISSREVRALIERLHKALREWAATPWDARRLIKGAGVIVLLAVASRLIAVLRRDWRSRRTKTNPRASDQVRIQASRWLRKLQQSELGQTPGPVMESLQRIRFGPQQTWGDVSAVFQQARRMWRDQRRQRPGVRGG